METPTRSPSSASTPRPRTGRGDRRPFGERQRARRAHARRLVASRTTRPLTPEQRAFDPLAHPQASGSRKLGILLLVVLGSVGVHLGMVGVGILIGRSVSPAARHDDMTIEMREPPPPPPPPPPPEVKPPEPPAPVEKPVRPPPPKVKAPPPPATPTPPPKTAPVRVVGLSLESTTEGGGGPSFAVGNTRLGDTDKQAKAPKDVGPAPSGTSTLPAAGGPTKTNQIASHIPVAGVEYGKPTPRGGKQKQPPYPSLLRSQGIEGDVAVLVSINAAGKVTAAKVLKASSYPEFDEAARKTALEQEWEPATRAGVPMAFTLSYTYRFRLENE